MTGYGAQTFDLLPGARQIRYFVRKKYELLRSTPGQCHDRFVPTGANRQPEL